MDSTEPVILSTAVCFCARKLRLEKPNLLLWWQSSQSHEYQQKLQNDICANPIRLAVRRFSSAQPFRKRFPFESNEYDEELCEVCASSFHNISTISAQFSQILSQLKLVKFIFTLPQEKFRCYSNPLFSRKELAYCNSAHCECFASAVKISCLKVTSKVTQSCHLLSFLTLFPSQETSKFLELWKQTGKSLGWITMKGRVNYSSLLQ